jgi:hypothetical protein
VAELAEIDAAPALLKEAAQLRRDALRMLEDWKALLGSNVPVSRQLLRKLMTASGSPSTRSRARPSPGTR